MIQDYDGPRDADTEIWGVNGHFRHQKGLTRIYAMDDISHFPPEWADEINLLPKRIRYIGPRHFPAIPRSEAFPLHEVTDKFNGIQFYTSTFAYILAAAIHEGFEKIVLAGAYWPHDSEEYIVQIYCVNFWLGIALGKGIKVEVWGPCCLGKPYPWEPNLYGYVTNRNREPIIQAMAASVKYALKFPFEPVVHTDPETLEPPTKEAEDALIPEMV